MKRPLAVTIIGWVFVAAGLVGLVYHASEFDRSDPFETDFLLVAAIRLLAIVFGGFALRGHNWARWGLIGWLGFHVGLSLHDLRALAIHGLFFVVLAYFSFRPEATAFFRAPKPSPF